MDLTFHPNKVLTIQFLLFIPGAYLLFKRIGVTSLDIQDYLGD